MAAESTVYGHRIRRYTVAVARFTIGDVIAKTRKQRRWNQTRLGEETMFYPLPGQVKPIDKGTISKVERDPYGSKFGTVWRLLAALELTLADAEREIGSLGRQGNASRGHMAVARSSSKTG